MASSSDWIAQAGAARRAPPAWLDALGDRTEFAEGAPFAQPRVAGLEPAGSPAPETPPALPEPGDEALAAAYMQGQADAQAEAERVLAAQRTLRLSLRELDQAALDALAADLTDTVMALCTQVIAEHAVDRAALVQRCEAAAARIGQAATQCRLRLHPDDAALIEAGDLGTLPVESDPALERGSLVLEGPDGAVRDGPAEWRRAIAAALQR